MAFCMNCGQQLPDGANFCLNCGTKLGETKTENMQRKTVYDGDLHKCPNCGELLKSFVTVCPACTYELRSVKTNSSVEALARKLEMTSSLNEKIELITNFYIPNTKEDIFDFFILAVSNLENKQYDSDDAWRAKLEQAYHKAKISFGNTADFDYLEKLYNRTCKTISKREKGIAVLFRKNKTVFISILMATGGIILLTIGIIMMINEISIGALLTLLSMSFFGFIIFVPEFIKDNDKKSKKKIIIQKNNSDVCSIGKDWFEFYRQNYEDMSEFLKARGFLNIVTQPEKKGILDIEGTVKSISIEGNTEFNKDDEYDLNTKIIIRYFSKQC